MDQSDISIFAELCAGLARWVKERGTDCVLT